MPVEFYVNLSLATGIILGVVAGFHTAQALHRRAAEKAKALENALYWLEETCAGDCMHAQAIVDHLKRKDLVVTLEPILTHSRALTTLRQRLQGLDDRLYETGYSAGYVQALQNQAVSAPQPQRRTA
jgi:UPF0288 family protein (methanogenesis marker protein 3)